MGAAAIGGGAGALGGILAGAGGTPDQRTGTQGTSTSQLQVGPMSQDQQQLQQNSMQQYLQQLALADQYQNGIGAAQGIQNQAMGNYQDILNGRAFQASPEMQQQIQGQRNLAVQQSTADINNLINDRLKQMQGQAGQQGLRGQAYTQLQGDAMRNAAQQYGNTVRGADLQAAQQTMQMPYQQVAAQGAYVQGGSQMANNMMQQAMMNRQAAQNPYLLQLLQNERLATGQNVTNSNGMQTQYGQQGSLMGALIGGLGGAAGGYGAGAQAANANSQSAYAQSKTPQT